MIHTKFASVQIIPCLQCALGSCKSDVIGADYRGKISQTRSGVQCQKWSSQKPHSHKFLPQEYAQEDLSENYCRNPDRESDGPWCYTADRNRRWEYCEVPLCQCKISLHSLVVNLLLCMSLNVELFLWTWPFRYIFHLIFKRICQVAHQINSCSTCKTLEIR